MRIKEGYILREVAGTHVVVSIGKAAIDFSGMLKLNESGTFLWNQLATGKTRQELCQALLEEYEIDEETVTADISEFIGKLKAANIIEE